MMNKKKIVFLTDLLLIPLFILTVYTGIELHTVGYDPNHEVWHNWAVFHTIVSFVFSVFGTIHVVSHWNWYKGLRKKGFRKKSKPVMTLSLLPVLITITGIWLLIGVEGTNTPIGMFHYVAGLVMSILGIFHVLKRRRFYTKETGVHKKRINTR